MPLFKVWSKNKLNKKFVVAQKFCRTCFHSLFSQAWRVGVLTLFEALTGVAFDRLNWEHSGEFDQNFSKKSNAPGFARGGGGMGGFGIDRYIKPKYCEVLTFCFDFCLHKVRQLPHRAS